MKGILHPIYFVFIGALVPTMSIEAATWQPIVRHIANPGFYGPLSQWWNIATDYEESHWQMFLHKYDFDSITVYRDDTTTCAKRMWRVNGTQYFSTVWTYSEGESPDPDYNPFDFTAERRTYLWQSPESPPVMTQNITTSTQYSIKHTVDHFPTSGAHLSPGTGSANINWYLQRLEAPWTGYITNSTAEYSKNVETPLSGSGGIDIPDDDVEVSAVYPGKIVL